MGAIIPHPALARRPDAGRELCQLVTDWTGKMPAAGAVVEPKIDGIRALFIDGELVTRGGVPIEAPHIVRRLKEIEHDQAVPFMFDGEYQVDGTFDATLRAWRTGEGNPGIFHAFEAMPARIWRGEDPGESLEVRRGRVDRLCGGDENAAWGVRPMPWTYLPPFVGMTGADTPSRGNVEAMAQEFIAAGAEGIVIKDAVATYQRRRSSLWQRIKKELTLDLRVTDYGEVAGKPLVDRLGLDMDGRRVSVAIKSPSEQLTLWRARLALVGAVCEVAAMERLESGALRHASYRRIRWDKGAA